MSDPHPEQQEPDLDAVAPSPGSDGTIDAAEQAYEPVVTEQTSRSVVEVRRTPRYWRFMLLGAVVFGIAGIVLTYAEPYDTASAGYSRGTVLGFTLLVSVAVGLAIGALVALLAERVSRRSIRLVEAEQTTTSFDDPQ